MINDYFRGMGVMAGVWNKHERCRQWTGVCCGENFREIFAQMDYNRMSSWAIDLIDDRPIDLPSDIRVYPGMNKGGELFFRIVVRVFDERSDYRLWLMGLELNEREMRAKAQMWLNKWGGPDGE